MNTVSETGSVLGWYGKLPSAGDFTSRGLPYDVVARLDGWLQAGLLQLRHHHPDWQYFFSHSPTWSFLVPGGVLSDAPLMGCLMPSHDKVGRAFPLVALRSPRPQRLLRSELPPQGRWHGNVIELMLDARHESFSAEQFDAEFRQLAAGTVETTAIAKPVVQTTDVLALFDVPADRSEAAPMDPARTFWGGTLQHWPDPPTQTSYWWTLGGGAASQRVAHRGALTSHLLIELLTGWNRL